MTRLQRLGLSITMCDQANTPVPPDGAEDHFYDPPDDDYDPDEDDGFDECGMMPDGYCTLAGSEWCDWDCPRNKPARSSLPSQDRGE